MAQVAVEPLDQLRLAVADLTGRCYDDPVVIAVAHGLAEGMQDFAEVVASQFGEIKFYIERGWVMSHAAAPNRLHPRPDPKPKK